MCHTAINLPTLHTQCGDYHRQENSKLWVQLHNITISEDKLLFPLLFGSEYNIDLLGSH